MRFAILGGAGAMGSALGAMLFEAGNDVTLVDVAAGAVEIINANGLTIQEKTPDGTGKRRTVKIPATIDPASVGVVDVAVVFVKCYHTESAVRNAAPLIGPETTMLSLQNGWGNAPHIAAIVGEDKVIAGVTYHSATMLEPGVVLHAGKGPTFIGEVGKPVSERVRRIVSTFEAAGVPTTAADAALSEIWKKLALNVVTLPTSATIRVTAERLTETPEMQNLMRTLLQEVAAVAAAKGIALDFDERWEAITGLLGRLAPGTKGSMLQDVEKGRKTEIDVINGAIVAGGKETGVPTPVNEAMVGLIKALEATF